MGCKGSEVQILSPRPILTSAVHPYSEKIIRYRAINDEGKDCEILERITFERLPHVAEPAVINRRFDLQTGEPLCRVGEDEFQVEATGARLRLQR